MNIAIITTNDFYSKIILNYINQQQYKDLYIIKINVPKKYTLKMALKGIKKSPIYFTYALYEKFILTIIEKKIKHTKLMNYSCHITTDDIHSKEFIHKLKQLNITKLFFLRPTVIIKKDFLDIFPESYNIHNTLLPKYRGLGGIFQTMAHGDKKLGLSIHKMTVKLDAGDIVYQDIIEIPEGYSLIEVTLLSYTKSRKLVKNFIEKLANNTLTYVEQDETHASSFSWPKFNSFVKFYKFNNRLFSLKNLKNLLKDI